jgi:cytidylate kinase
VTIWTIESDESCGGDEIARSLAARAGVPLVAEQFLLALALDLGTTVNAARDVRESASSMFIRYALAAGAAARPAPELARELERYKRCRTAFERTAREAARAPCVIVGHGAFATLSAHPGARHVRIRGPREWRAQRLAASTCTSLARARWEVARSDRVRRRRFRRIFGLDPDDLAQFHVVYDASRLRPEEIVDALLTFAPTELREARADVG